MDGKDNHDTNECRSAIMKWTEFPRAQKEEHRIASVVDHWQNDRQPPPPAVLLHPLLSSTDMNTRAGECCSPFPLLLYVAPQLCLNSGNYSLPLSGGGVGQIFSYVNSGFSCPRRRRRRGGSSTLVVVICILWLSDCPIRGPNRKFDLFDVGNSSQIFILCTPRFFSPILIRVLLRSVGLSSQSEWNDRFLGGHEMRFPHFDDLCD